MQKNYIVLLAEGRYLAWRGGEWVNNGTPDLFTRDEAHNIAATCGYNLTTALHIEPGEYKVQQHGFGTPPYKEGTNDDG